MRRTIGTIAPTGIGKPDYSKEVSSGTVKPGIRLKYNESLLAFMAGFSPIASAYSWIRPPLAPGAMVHFVDSATGIDLPYIIPLGYTMNQVQYAAGFNEDIESSLYLGGQLFASSRLAGGTPQMEASVIAFDSALIDSAGAWMLPFDLQITNIGLGNLLGSFGYNMVLVSVGTSPLPGVKTVKCKWCGALKEVPEKTTIVTCDNCGQVTMYYRMMRGHNA